MQVYLLSLAFLLITHPAEYPWDWNEVKFEFWYITVVTALQQANGDKHLQTTLQKTNEKEAGQQQLDKQGCRSFNP